MNKKQNGTPDRYPPDLKIAIAREYQKGELGYLKLGRKYGFSGDTVRSFVNWYKSHYPQPEPPADPQGTLHSNQSEPAGDKELSKALELANLKIAALEMLIENTNKELGYDIGKKGGTGQSSK